MYQMIAAAASKINVGKLIKYIVIAIAIIVGIRYLRKYLKSRKNRAAIRELAKDINTSLISYPLSYFGIWAGDLYNAVKGWGTDEQAIYNIISKLKTKDDVLQLITTFGVKDKLTLNQWIADDMNDKERSTLNRLLTDKNIDYQF